MTLILIPAFDATSNPYGSLSTMGLDKSRMSFYRRGLKTQMRQ